MLRLAAAFPGPAPASRRPYPATLVPASREPPSARLLPHAGPSGPSSCFAVASPGPAPAQPDGASGPLAAFLDVCPSRPSSCLPRWPVRAQSLPKSASPGPAPARRRPLGARTPPHTGPCGPGSCLSMAASGPAPACWRSLQAWLLPLGLLSRPRTGSSWPLQARLSLLAASAGPAPASQPRSAQLPAAIVGPRLPCV
nr:basic proline-rich protein-like [Gorilla gorilla gorilla]